MLPIPALPPRCLQNRWGCLLDLQEERVLRVASLKQDDKRPGADTAHANHLAGHVHDLEAFQQVTPVVLQGGPVGAELLADRVADLVGG